MENLLPTVKAFSSSIHFLLGLSFLSVAIYNSYFAQFKYRKAKKGTGCIQKLTEKEQSIQDLAKKEQGRKILRIQVLLFSLIILTGILAQNYFSVFIWICVLALIFDTKNENQKRIQGLQNKMVGNFQKEIPIKNPKNILPLLTPPI